MREADLVFLCNLGIIACLMAFGAITSHFLDRPRYAESSDRTIYEDVGRARRWLRAHPWLLAPLAMGLARLATLDWSSYSWYMGFNEAVYTQIADNYRQSPWVPLREGHPFYDTGPFFTYLAAATRDLLGHSEFATRLASLLAYPVILEAAYRIAEAHRPATGGRAVALLATTPFLVLWVGRAQTDTWMLAGIMLYLAGLSSLPARGAGAAAAVGLAIGLLAKQPAILCLVGLVALPAAQRRQALVWSLAGLAAAGTWWGLQYLAHRVSLGENATMVLVAFLLGAGGLWAFTAKWRPMSRLLALELVVYLVFAILEAPIGHEYYALPAVALATTAAASWAWSRRSLGVCLVVNIVLAGGLLVYAGDVADHRTEELGGALQDLHAHDVVAPTRLTPQLRLYAKDPTIAYGGLEPGSTAGLWVVAYHAWPECRVAHKASAPFGRDWYLLQCPA
jgi:hypothetical protein